MEYVSKYNKINVAEVLSPSPCSGGKKTPIEGELISKTILPTT